MTPPQPIIDRIRKLAAMADRGTEHEAALAGERMQSLLQEYNLTRAEVESQADSTVKSELAAREQKDYARSAHYKYQRDLMQTIAENNFCIYFVRQRWVKDPMTRWVEEEHCKTKRVKRHVIIGRSDNVSATIIMYDYLMECMENLCPYKGKERVGENAKLWLAGCTETLCARLVKQRTGREEQKPLNNAPGLVRLADLYGSEADLNYDFMHDLEPGTTARKRREREAAQVEIERKERELVSQGTDAYDAWYMARGYDVPSREPQQVSKETEGQRNNRRHGGGRQASGWTQKDQREWDRRNSSAFNAGKDGGHKIGLGGSLKDGPAKELIGG